jgi:hypothetical protein
MMKKTTQIFLLVVSALVLLVSVTVSAQGQPAQDRRRGNAPDFTGEWNTVTDRGNTIVMTLRHERADPSVVTGIYARNGLTGSYKPLDRSINAFVKVSARAAEPVSQNVSSLRGKVTGNVLRFTWVEDGGQGAGRFTLSSDGESFEGTFSRTSNPDDTSGGSWNGTRRHSFAGAWRGKLGEGGFELVLQQAGAYQVVGRLNINSVIYDIKEGRVDANNTLRFQVVRAGRPLPNGARLPDEVLGAGELAMDAGGRSFNGKILNADASGTLIAR